MIFKMRPRIMAREAHRPRSWVNCQKTSHSHSQRSDLDNAKGFRWKEEEYTKSTNGREKQKRDWLMYSESARAIYCVPCMLFSSDGLKNHHQPVHLTPKKGTKYQISNGGECTTNSLTMKFSRRTKPATSRGKI